jgi:hypothetical protein
MRDLTYDHVMPRSKGGKTTWTNIATCCVDCNSRKGGRTPEQAGMRLLKAPIEPKVAPAVMFRFSRESAPREWQAFAYWTGELEED